MGLDNGFIIRRKGDDCLDNCIELAYFRKFYELDSFIRDHCTSMDDEGCGDMFSVSVCDLLKLEAELEPIVKVLNRIPMRLIDKYDEGGYPAKYKFDSVELSGELFNPAEGGTAFKGYKTMKLYHAVKTMINFSDHNEDCEILFYSSY